MASIVVDERWTFYVKSIDVVPGGLKFEAVLPISTVTTFPAKPQYVIVTDEGVESVRGRLGVNGGTFAEPFTMAADAVLTLSVFFALTADSLRVF